MSAKRINLVILFCFLFSGVCGLIYEVTWAKYFSLIFGSTTYAHTLVLATFMGGLALGSFLFGWYADRIKGRLNLYAWLEMGIALFCAFTPRLFGLLKDFYLSAASNFNLGPPAILMIKFIAGAFIMLIPTILMGGTLPVLSKYMVNSLSVRGQTVARLYYINSFGAVLGTLLAGFYLVYHFGLELSITIAAAINFLAGVTVLVVSKGPLRLSRAEQAALKAAGDERRPDSRALRVLSISLAGIFLSGLAAMLYEVVWIRLLSLILGSYTYSFSLMLAAFISGITIGSFLISKFMPEDKFTFLYFGLCEIFIGLSLILALPFYEKLPYLFLEISQIFARIPKTFLLFEGTKFLLCFLVMLPPTVFLGMTLPLVSKIASGKLEFLGAKIGSVFALNTIGNILGAMLTGLLFIPAFGLKQTLEIGVMINLTLGSLILWADRSFPRRYSLIFIALCFLAFIGYGALSPEWNKSYFTAQLFRGNRITGKSSLDYLRNNRGREFLFYEDGLEATVAVTLYKKGNLNLFVNGKVDASSGLDMPTQILCSQLPLVLKTDAKDALVVGLGSGISCGSALGHPIENLDVVEISSSVVRASKYFNQFNYNALKDKRLHLYVEDAKTFIKRAKKKYDLIISEPSNPWMSGVGSLFSIEYFTDCSKRLKEDGLMVQWVQAYETDEDTFKIILRTFRSVFPEVTVWNPGHSDIIIIGSKKMITPDFKESEKALNLKPVKEDLSRIALKDLFTLLSLQICSTADIDMLVAKGGIINSDYYPVLEYRAPLSLYVGSNAMEFLMKLDARKFPILKTSLLLVDYLKERKIDGENLKNLFAYLESNIELNQENLVRSLAKRWVTEFPQDAAAISAYALYNNESLDRGLIALRKVIQEESSFDYLKQYAALEGKRYFSMRSFLAPEIFNETQESLRWCISISKDKKPYFYSLLGSLCFGGRDYACMLASYLEAEKTIKSIKDAQAQELDYAGLLSNISAAYFANANPLKGAEYLKKARLVNKPGQD